MSNDRIYVSELSTTTHKFKNYHFCRGNSNKRKTRIGLILKGTGTYIYLNKKLSVREGDTVFIPENIFCYSEWHGNPDIEVVYVSCFMHYENFSYEAQVIDADAKTTAYLMEIKRLLSSDYSKELEAYSLFYKFLSETIPKMPKSNISFDKTLQAAVEFITEHWNESFAVSDVAKSCCVSESTLYHLFQKELGQSPIGFLNSIKINKAIEYLENSHYSVSTIRQLVGFNSENHFRKLFKSITGESPLKYRKRK